MTNQTIFIKFGGSAITDIQKPKTAKSIEIRRLLMETMEARRDRNFDLIIGHGSGSFGHAPSKKYKINERGVKDTEGLIGSVITEQETSQLNRIVVDVALKNNFPVFSFPPHSFGMASNHEFSISYGEHIITAIKIGFIPLVYGDIVIDLKRGSADISTEEVLKSISCLIKPDIVIMGTDVDGLFTNDPKINSHSKLIEVVNSRNIDKALRYAKGSTKIDSTGGMKTMVSNLYKIVQSTHAIGYIINATKKGYINRILSGKEVVCTTFKPD